MNDKKYTKLESIVLDEARTSNRYSCSYEEYKEWLDMILKAGMPKKEYEEKLKKAKEHYNIRDKE